MRNCLITGSGRSGTSMVAGVVASAGYFFGDHPYKSRDANPTGFFEDAVVNGVNEDILAKVVPAPPRGPLRFLFDTRPRTRQRWLAQVPVATALPTSPDLDHRIVDLVGRTPFAFKDPRFCYTLPVWRPHLPADTVFVCVFREPGRTTNSILKECRETPYLQGLRIDFPQALRVWTLMYRHVLDMHSDEGEWLFLHYDQALDGSAWPRLQRFLKTDVDHGMVTSGLKRSLDRDDIPSEAAEIYTRLCHRAGYEVTSQGAST